MVGLCNVPIAMGMGTAKSLGVDLQRIRIDFARLNHMIFGLRFYLNGNNITGEAIAKMAAGEVSVFVKNVKLDELLEAHRDIYPNFNSKSHIH